MKYMTVWILYIHTSVHKYFIQSVVIVKIQYLIFLFFFPLQFILTHSDGKKFREVLESNPTKLLNIAQQQVKWNYNVHSKFILSLL